MDEQKNSVGFLADLTDQIALALRRKLSVTPDKATEIALDVANEMRELWSGVSVYMCKTDPAALNAKHEAIFDAWRQAGGFSLDMCRRFDLTEQRIRQIVALKRREKRQKAVDVELPFDVAS